MFDKKDKRPFFEYDVIFCRFRHASNYHQYHIGVNKLIGNKKNFGTAPVFLTAISTILGAIMFLRFGYAVGNVSFYGSILIIVIGHLVTIPTAMAIGEIATNQKVEGGGEYYIVSRSFGLNIGASIGVALYFSQAISVAFYVIAFAEAFSPVYDFVNAEFGLNLTDKRLVSVPAAFALIALMLTRGADIGVKALYVVVSILVLSLIMFFLGRTGYAEGSAYLYFNDTVDNPDNFFYVFAIVFPAFTGMTAGVGLSGELRDPKKSIPLGTLSATLIGMVIYVLIAYKLAISASPDDLSNDQLVMGKIALWGPIIPIGLACATISSAIGSIMVAPRTLQALGADQIFPFKRFNAFLRMGKPGSGEPYNATLITSAIALIFVLMGDVNAVAKIISMFFMVTYGSLCLISFMQHFAGDPSYRPAFRSRWYISLIGAVGCLYLMLKMDATYAFVSLGIMALLYIGISGKEEKKQGLAKIFQGVIFQLSRTIQIFIQKAEKEDMDSWRPSLICISEIFFKRPAAFNLIRWLSHKYGFGTYLHFIRGYVSKETLQIASRDFEEILDLSSDTRSNVYIDTMISPSYTSAIAQAMQMPSVSGKDINMILFEYAKGDVEEIEHIIDNFSLVKVANFDVCILASSPRDFGFKRRIDIWITQNDYENSSLMILMGYVLMGHPDWRDSQINIFAIFPSEDINVEKEKLIGLIREGRLPISANNIELIEKSDNLSDKQIINDRSKNADLTIIGIRSEPLKQLGTGLFEGYNEIGNILFLNASKTKLIV
jgi:amino acid transporter